MKPYTLAQACRLRRKIEYSEVFVDYIGRKLAGKTFNQFVSTVWSHLPEPTPRSAVRQSLMSLVGQDFTRDSLNEMAWRLAGNVDKLRDGKTVSKWVSQASDEVVPVQIIESYPTVTRFGEFATKFVVRVLAGTPCPMILDTVWNSSRCRYRSAHLGFSAPWGKYPYKHPAQFVGLRMHVLLEAAKSGAKPYFELGIEEEPNSIIAYNRKLLVARARLPGGFECPQGFDHPCHLCPIGYRDCPAACHPLTYESRVCPRCGDEQWFDPARKKQKHCIECHFEHLKDKTNVRHAKT